MASILRERVWNEPDMPRVMKSGLNGVFVERDEVNMEVVMVYEMDRYRSKTAAAEAAAPAAAKATSPRQTDRVDPDIEPFIQITQISHQLTNRRIACLSVPIPVPSSFEAETKFRNCE